MKMGNKFWVYLKRERERERKETGGTDKIRHVET